MLHGMWRRRLLQSALVALLTGCNGASGSGSEAPDSVAPSPSVRSSAAQSEPALSPATFPVVSLPPQSKATLTAARSVADLPGGPATSTLAAGMQVLIAAGPRDVEGGTWYELLLLDATSSVGGWAPIDDPSALTPVETTCPETADALLAMAAWDQVRCFAGATVSVEGTVGHCQGGVVFAEPAWLAYACWDVSDPTGRFLALHAAPESGIVFPDDLVRARLTGHFDDQASETCRYIADVHVDPWRVPGEDEQILLCREAFVVDTIEILEVIGTPPLS